MEIIWTCDHCQQEISDGEGYIFVNSVDVGVTENWWRVYERELDTKSFEVISIADAPEIAQWETMHRDCDDRLNESDYWVAVERIRTPLALLLWTTHLMKKRWIQYTDWTYFAEEAALRLDPAITL